MENTTAVGQAVGETVGVQSRWAVCWLIDFRTDALLDMNFRVFSFPPFFFLASRFPNFSEQNWAGAAGGTERNVATWRLEDRTYEVCKCVCVRVLVSRKVIYRESRRKAGLT